MKEGFKFKSNNIIIVHDMDKKLVINTYAVGMQQ